MIYLNQFYDPISTVQLSPFVEEQWHRIDTYSPISTDWQEMSFNSQQRTHRPTSGKLNIIDQVDLNTLKLDDEILLNELHDIRRGSALLARAKQTTQKLKVVHTDQKQKSTETLTDNCLTTTNLLHQSKVPLKQTLTEPSYVNQQQYNSRSLSSNKTSSFQVNPTNQMRKFPGMNFGPQPQPSLAAQLRQSAIIRRNNLLTTNDPRLLTPLSSPIPKRSLNSAHSNRQYQQQELQMRHEINSIGSNDDQFNEEPLPSTSRPRAKSAYSSRSTVHLLKAKNDRMRQKHSIELKSILIKPWKTETCNDDVLGDPIPNSLDMMHKMCGPATPFERNLRQDYHKQLSQYRISSIK
ncbi:hypothetical protein I4U23_007222 [Adineta vaga]|nr:hypothetical protein I4U23_007222 [Adineta vaga]